MFCSNAGRDLQLCKYLDNEQFCSDASRRLLSCKKNSGVEELCDLSNEPNYQVNQNYNKEDHFCSRSMELEYNSNKLCLPMNIVRTQVDDCESCKSK